MREWHVRALRLTVQNHLPFGDALRAWKRQRFGYAPDPANLDGACRWAEQVVTLSQEHGRPVDGATVLEIGSGWFPVLPMVMASAGAERVYMTDIKRHQDDATFNTTASYLRDKGWKLSLAPLRYLAPFDPGDIPDQSVDIVVSRTVLEHIRPADLSALFAALRPKMKLGGLHIHLVDHSDHWEHRDKSISRAEFLTRPQWLHDLIWNAVGDGENRLRHPDYEPIFVGAGYRVLMAEAKICEKTLAKLPALKLQAPWNAMLPEHVATIESVYVLQA